MSKWIYNNDTIAHTYSGQEIASSTYYQIEDIEEVRWMNNSTLLDDIASGDAIVSKSNNSADHITDTNDAINYLKNKLSPVDSNNSPIVRIRAFNNADNLKFRGTGISGTATKNTTTNIEYKLTEDRFINGVDILIKDHVWGDKINFEVVDIDNILGYGAGTVLDQFGKDWYVDPDKCSQGQIRVEYPALINKDLYVRLAYISTGATNDVEVKANLFLHKKP